MEKILMPYKIFIILFLTFHLSIRAQVETHTIDAPLQQQNVDTDEKTKTKLGIKFNLGWHTFLGTEFNNTKHTFGFGAGMYQIINLNKKKSLQFHWEFNANYKGSKFGKTNDTSFSKISLLYGEIPCFMSIRIANNAKKQPLFLIVGGQFGVLFKATISKGFGELAEVKYDNLPLRKIDFMPAIGLRKDIGSGMSLQTTTKLGLININSSRLTSGTPGTRYPDIVPRMSGKGTIFNFSFDIALLF